ncbi:MAG: hypothetical protein HQL27_04340 [Candidatus Omnitrophica bacterium]|nr:hypothetical protein [Candidatus Omnitrophota bacterium]
MKDNDGLILIVVIVIASYVLFSGIKTLVKKSFSLQPKKKDETSYSIRNQKDRMEEIKDQHQRFRKQQEDKMRAFRRK